MKKILEIAVDSVSSALYAAQGGANRLELCENLDQGGVTPSAAKIKLIKAKVDIPAFVLIRPRKGDFLYTDIEFETMLENIRLAKELGVDGIVSGVLLADGQIDLDRTSQLVKATTPLSFTFHRAFDMCCKPEEALEQLIELGVARILTSGQEPNAIEGKENIARFLQIANGRIQLMAGGGVRPKSIHQLLEIEGLNEYHSSARNMVESRMQYRGDTPMGSEAANAEFQWSEVKEEMVRAMQEQISRYGK